MKKTTIKKRTLRISQVTVWDLLEATKYDYPRVKRPRTRADCRKGTRPCPWVSCRYHLYLDVTKYGSIKIYRPDIDPWQMNESCALDIAERGKHSLRVTGKYYGISGEQVRQVTNIALEKLQSDLNRDQKVA